MNHATGTALIPASVGRVRDALLAATRLPEWNPAFVRVTGPAHATPETTYELEVIRGLRGTLTYTQVEAGTIAFAWHVPGLNEMASRTLDATGATQTRVTHTVERRGMLAAALAHTLGTLPRLRLDRLAEHTATPQPA